MNLKSMNINTAIVFGLISMTAAHAEVKDYYSECTNKHDRMNNSVVYDCSAHADEKYKKIINSSYKKIHKALKSTYPDKALALEKSQLGWLDYRNNYCSLAGSYAI